MNVLSSITAALSWLGGEPVLARLAMASVELAVLAAAVWVALRLFRVRSARIAALLWLVVLAKPLVALPFSPLLPVFTLQLPERQIVTPIQIPTDAPAAHPGPVHAEAHPGQASAPPATPSPTAGAQRSRTVTAAEILIYLWAAGVAAMVLYAVVQRIRLRGLIAAARPAPAIVQERYAQIANLFGIKRLPRIAVSDAVESPALAGTLRPVVLIPCWLAEGPETAPLDWALRHELMHWRLRDPVAYAIRQLAQILFFFHPVAWWAGRKWEVAAELACDRALIATETDATGYAEALYQILQQIHLRRRRALLGGLFATRTQVGRRIAALLTNPLRQRAKVSFAVGAALAVVAALCLAAGLASEREEPWRARFNAVYRLEPGEVLRRIAPPFIPERLEHCRADWDGNSIDSEPYDFVALCWNGKLSRHRAGRNCWHRYLADVLEEALDLACYEYEGPPEALGLPLPGDWIVRTDAEMPAKLAALSEIIRRDTGRVIRFELRHEKRDIIVARGLYRFHPLQQAERQDEVYLFSDTLKDDAAGGSGAGDVAFLLRGISINTGMPVIDETFLQGIGYPIIWVCSSSAIIKDLPEPERTQKLDMLLANLTKQTSLTFTKERREMNVWIVSEEALK